MWPRVLNESYIVRVAKGMSKERDSELSQPLLIFISQMGTACADQHTWAGEQAA